MDENRISRSQLLAHAVEIVVAWLSNSAVEPAEVPNLIQRVFDTLSTLGGDGDRASVELVPAVPIRRSVTDDYIICLEDGKKLKTLKRHLATAYGMTPDEYRARWGLKPDYPMVAPAYARKRSELAKSLGLGRKPAAPPPPAPKRARARTRAA